jgi:hypothetical protein
MKFDGTTELLLKGNHSGMIETIAVLELNSPWEVIKHFRLGVFRR